jgi:hypothetical protein
MKTYLKDIYSITEKSEMTLFQKAKHSIHSKLHSTLKLGSLSYVGAFALLILSSCNQNQTNAEAQELDSKRIGL